MKVPYIALITLCLSFVANAQWINTSSGNPFDGENIISVSVGTDGAFLMFRKWHRGGSLDFSIGSTDAFVCSEVQIDALLNGERVPMFSSGIRDNLIFISYPTEWLRILSRGYYNTLLVRTYDGCNSEATMEFSLIGVPFSG